MYIGMIPWQGSFLYKAMLLVFLFLAVLTSIEKKDQKIIPEQVLKQLVEVGPSVHLFNTFLSSSHTLTDQQRYTDLKVSGNPLFHHRLPLPVEEEEEEETYDEINIMRPVYGITSMEWNFVQFNTIRSKKDEVCAVCM